MPTLLIRQGRNPYEVTVAIAIVALTVYAALNGHSTSKSVEVAMGRSQQLAWTGLSSVGALITLAGLFWPRQPMTGLFIERAGQLMLAGAVAAYMVVLCTVSTFERSGLVMGLGSAVAIGAVLRVVTISAGIRRIRAAQSLVGRG